jgi:flagellar basal-body rod protein FlgG
MRALSIASTGMLAQQTNVEVIANNLANMNTTAFKQQRAEFADLLYQNIQTPGSQTSDQGTYAPNGIQLGAGVRTAAVYRILTQGDLKATGNPMTAPFRAPASSASTGRRHRRLFAFGQFLAVAPRPAGHQDGLIIQPASPFRKNTMSVTINSQGQVNALVRAIPRPRPSASSS